MKVSREELLHIANLAQLEIKENEIEEYIRNLEEILDMAEVVSSAPVEELDITIGTNEAKNRFRKDEIKMFDNIEGMLKNGKDVKDNMFKLPKVL